jgi:hypothetical protein
VIQPVPSPKFHWNTVLGDVLVLLFMKSSACGAQAWVRPPKGIWIEALVLFSMVNVPVTTQPVPGSVSVTV